MLHFSYENIFLHVTYTCPHRLDATDEICPEIGQASLPASYEVCFVLFLRKEKKDISKVRLGLGSKMFHQERISLPD